MRFSITMVLWLCFSWCSVAYADQNLENMSEKLIQLRGEVESLNSEIRFLKEEHSQEMNFLWSQRNQIKSDIERNKNLLARLNQDLEAVKAENAQKGQSSEHLLPQFEQAISQIEVYLNDALPFKKAERLASLQEIDTQVKKELISVQRGFNKLWAFVEDEIRLTKESGLYQDSVLIAGEDRKQLVDLARIGMMTLYFQTQDNQVGQLVKTASGQWEYQLLRKPLQTEQVAYLFDSMQTQIRTGLFQLPTKQAIEE